MAKKGRKQLDIPSEEVLALAKMGATNVEIAHFFSCDEGTILKRFSENLAKGRSERKIKLRQLQWRAAEKGSVGMLIWLGKQILGQKDVQEITGTIGLRYAELPPEERRKLIEEKVRLINSEKKLIEAGEEKREEEKPDD